MRQYQIRLVLNHLADEAKFEGEMSRNESLTPLLSVTRSCMETALEEIRGKRKDKSKEKIMKQKSNLTRIPMKHLAMAALLLNFGVAAIYAQPGSVDMTVSGTGANSAVQITPGSPASEYNLTGEGTLGPFTFRVVNSSAAAPDFPSTCTGLTKIHFAAVAGAGVLRSWDGSLLTVNLTGGGDCIDFAANQALCIRIFQITGGTGRFKNATGALTLTMTVVPLLTDDSINHNPVFFSVTGDVKGTASKVSIGLGLSNGPL